MIEQMLAHRAPFDETIAAIDRCAAMPGADPTYMASLHGYRLIALDIHERSDSEVFGALDAYLKTDAPLASRAISITAACTDRASVAALYLPPLINELEAAIADSTDQSLERALQQSQAVCDRLGVSY